MRQIYIEWKRKQLIFKIESLYLQVHKQPKLMKKIRKLTESLDILNKYLA